MDSSSIITFKSSQEPLIQSILNTGILTNAFTDNQFTQLNLTFYTDVSDLTKCTKSYNIILYMIHCLSSQQIHLQKMGYSFYTFTLKDIIVVNGCYFFCINPELIMPLKQNKYLTFYKPPIQSPFSSPELVQNDTIPFKVTYKTIYYSIGILAIYCFHGCKQVESKQVERTSKDLLQIHNTKLYWFLLRCIDEKAEDRILLFL